MSEETYGEQVFKRYLDANGLQLQHQPYWTHTEKRPDYCIPHPVGDVILEIKDIEGNMFGGVSAGSYDPYKLIRDHINAATRQFKDFADYACVLALKAGKFGIVDLETPYVVLGAMYGDFGFQIPVDTDKGRALTEGARPSFLQGRGKMVRLRGDGLVVPQNTRISAVLTIHDYPSTRGAAEPGVTVWENAYACRRLPADLFRGRMDRWYGVDQYQGLSFEGEGLKPGSASADAV